MTQKPSAEDLVRAAVRGEMDAPTSRVIQTENGSWLSSWHGVPGKTPPIEERHWLCPGCWRQIDEHARATRSSKFVVMERIKNVEELHLKTEIFCLACAVDLTHAAEALVEVY